jgi:hypothetical protein
MVFSYCAETVLVEMDRIGYPGDQVAYANRREILNKGEAGPDPWTLLCRM